MINYFKNFISPNKPDYYLLLTTSILIIIGIIFSYSLSMYIVWKKDFNEFHFLIRQFYAGMVGIIILFLFAHIKPEKLVPFITWILFGFFSLIILSMKFLPETITIQAGGATRWIKLPGFSISPVEFFKIGFIYYLAHSFNRRLNVNKKHTFFNETLLILPYGIIFFLIAIFVAIIQKELGQTLVIATIIFMMLIFANRSWKILSAIILLGITAFISLIIIFPHRIGRIQSWWGSVQDTVLSYLPSFFSDILKISTYQEAYQVNHSINAIFNGNLLGEGIGNGFIKLGFLGEIHTDFVLAGIIEEIGFIGIFLIVLLFIFIILRILKISKNTDNYIFHLFSIGIATMFGTSFLINSFGTSGIIPIKGLPIPFLSYGGSSLIASCIAIGLVLSISNSINKDKKKI